MLRHGQTKMLKAPHHKRSKVVLLKLKETIQLQSKEVVVDQAHKQ
jgi:hypothetical protein